MSSQRRGRRADIDREGYGKYNIRERNKRFLPLKTTATAEFYFGESARRQESDQWAVDTYRMRGRTSKGAIDDS